MRGRALLEEASRKGKGKVLVGFAKAIPRLWIIAESSLWRPSYDLRIGVGRGP